MILAPYFFGSIFDGIELFYRARIRENDKMPCRKHPGITVSSSELTSNLADTCDTEIAAARIDLSNGLVRLLQDEGLVVVGKGARVSGSVSGAISLVYFAWLKRTSHERSDCSETW